MLAGDPRFADHLTGDHHPERPARLRALAAAFESPLLEGAVRPIEFAPAPPEVIGLVHPVTMLQRLDDLVGVGGGWVDADTVCSPKSLEAAHLAVGAGLAAVAALQRGEGDAAFCAVRPPGHHATRTQSMGFCLVSNIAIVARTLVDAGERVWIFDFDAHHGNGTQDVFFDDPRVLFVSTHQWPLYPGTGRRTEIGAGDGIGTTINIPLPPEATGDVYLRAFDSIVAPAVERFAPTWLLISAGFDAHREDPLTELGLTAGDFAALTHRATALVPKGRVLAMLEGGYDLRALRDSSLAVLGALTDSDAEVATVIGPDEAPSNGGPGEDAVAATVAHWHRYHYG